MNLTHRISEYSFNYHQAARLLDEESLLHIVGRRSLVQSYCLFKQSTAGKGRGQSVALVGITRYNVKVN